MYLAQPFQPGRSRVHVYLALSHQPSHMLLSFTQLSDLPVDLPLRWRLHFQKQHPNDQARTEHVHTPGTDYFHFDARLCMICHTYKQESITQEYATVIMGARVARCLHNVTCLHHALKACIQTLNFSHEPIRFCSIRSSTYTISEFWRVNLMRLAHLNSKIHQESTGKLLRLHCYYPLQKNTERPNRMVKTNV